MSHLETAPEAAQAESGSEVVPRVSSEESAGLASGLYVGRVRHRRFEPVRNDFTYSGFWLLLDLDELDEVFRGRWLWSTRRSALMRFRREDHLLFPDDISGLEDLDTVPSPLGGEGGRRAGEGAVDAGVGGATSRSTEPKSDTSLPHPAFGHLLPPEGEKGRSGLRSFGVKPKRKTEGTLPPLDESVRSLVEFSTGRRPGGPIRLLTQVRCFGYLMNPVSFYYCFDEGGERLETVVAEVNNTPWGERHCYVLDASSQTEADQSLDEAGGTLAGNSHSNSADSASPSPFEAVRISPGSSESRHLRFEHEKRFHVSPFMQMNMSYRWRLSPPGGNLTVQIENWRQEKGDSPADQPLFDVTFHLKRRPMTGGQLARVLVRHPFMTGKFVGAIYWQALKLWWKRCPFVPHPNSKIQEASES